MAKRTPRTEADDPTNIAASAPRQTRPSTGDARPDATEGRGQARTGRETAGASTAAPESADTFAARPAQTDSFERDMPPEGQSDPLGFQPSEEEIRYRAYLLYIERGGEHGMDFEDWLQAERELKGRR
jgi:Protein of unknown function (DUF2934)